MKTFIFNILLFLIGITAYGQINYQAVVRDENGSPMIEETIDFDVQILQEGNSVYSESHPGQNTGTLGLVNLAIGTGMNPSGPFDEIDWSAGDFEIQVFIDGLALPPSPINAVPVAEYAKNAGSSEWSKNDEEDLYFNDGLVGVGNTNPEYNLDLRGILNIEGVESPNPAHTKLRLRAQSSEFDNRIRSMDENNEVMWQQILGRRTSGNNFELINAQTQKVFWVTQNGVLNVAGINGSSAAHTKVSLAAQSADFDNRIRSMDENYDVMWQIILGRRSSSNAFQLINAQTQNVFWVTQSGQTNVKCLKINGGCDITEPFETGTTNIIAPGTVVVMTEEGILPSNRAHDKRVVGVISGANGVKTGMQLSQTERFENGQPVAIAGRVYVRTTGEVNIGDLLVSSDTPGVAMAEPDPINALNRSIGKALSTPDEEGFVLMLVNIQ